MRGDTYRFMVFEFPFTHRAPASSRNLRTIRLDLGAQGGPHPHETRTVTPISARLLEARGTSGAEYSDLRPFEVEVLHPARTCLEKLEIINSTAIALQMGQRDNLTSRDGKHPYDVYCILDHPASLDLLSDSDEKSRMLESIAESSGRWFGVPFTRPDGGYADSAAFSTDEQGKEFQRVYERALKDFLWHGAARPKWHEVVERITSFRSLL